MECTLMELERVGGGRRCEQSRQDGGFLSWLHFTNIHVTRCVASHVRFGKSVQSHSCPSAFRRFNKPISRSAQVESLTSPLATICTCTCDGSKAKQAKCKPFISYPSSSQMPYSRHAYAVLPATATAANMANTPPCGR